MNNLQISGQQSINLRKFAYNNLTGKWQVHLYGTFHEFDSETEAEYFLIKKSQELNECFGYINSAYTKILTVAQANIFKLSRKEIRAYNELIKLINEKLSFLTVYAGQSNHYYYHAIVYIAEKLAEVLKIIARYPEFSGAVKSVEKSITEFLARINEIKDSEIKAISQGGPGGLLNEANDNITVKERKKRRKYRKAKRTGEIPEIKLKRTKGKKVEKDKNILIEDFNSYQLSIKRRSPHTCVSYKTALYQFNSFLKRYDLSLITVDKKAIRSFLAELHENKITPRAINSKLYALNCFYKFCMKQGLISKSPTYGVNSLKWKKKQVDYLPESRVIHVLDLIPTDSVFSFRDRLVLELLFGTGLRSNELITLKIKDVWFKEKLIMVTGKGNKQRLVPVPGSVLKLIKSFLRVWQHRTEYLIETDEKNQSYKMLIYRICRHYMNCYPHVLRHSYATALINNGAPLIAIKDLLGHSCLLATEIYTHIENQKIKNDHEKAHPKSL